jgi:hypothetical protein
MGSRSQGLLDSLSRPCIHVEKVAERFSLPVVEFELDPSPVPGNCVKSPDGTSLPSVEEATNKLIASLPRVCSEHHHVHKS